MDLTKDNISTLIRQIAIPSSIGTLFQTLYNIVDVKFAGLISPDAITAIAKSFPIYFIIIGFTAGLSIGVTALISNALGKNDEKKASLLLAQAILTSLIISALVTLVGIYGTEPILIFLKTNPEIMNAARARRPSGRTPIMAVSILFLGQDESEAQKFTMTACLEICGYFL